jgi:ketosteroid isomerase-like protein
MEGSEQAREGELVALARRFFPDEMDMVEFVRAAGDIGFDPETPMADDFEVEFLPRALGSQLAGRGLQGMVEGWREWLEPYESYLIRITDFEQLGPDRVMVLVDVDAVTSRDGVRVEHHPAAVATIRDGLLVKLFFYLDPELARRGETQAD